MSKKKFTFISFFLRNCLFFFDDNIYQANQINCQIITVPHDILKKIPLIGKNLDDLSLETVQTFLNDATKAGFKIKINK